MAPRDIDTAMAEVRPAKLVVRRKWIRVCRDWRSRSTHEPLYVTLPGSDGHDIEMLIAEGLLPVLENDAIDDKAAGLVVAVEKDVRAAGALRARFPGLKVVPRDITTELRIQRPISDLSREVKQYGRGLVINLDFTAPLTVSDDEKYPLLELVGRLGDLHRYPTVQDWTLLLTLNAGTQVWPVAACIRHARTLQEMIRDSSALESWWQKYGRELSPVVAGTELYRVWTVEQQQYLVLALVPLLLLGRLTATHWNPTVRWAAAYGERDRHQAPMVTWIIDVTYDPQACAEPIGQRREFVEPLSRVVGKLDGNGTWLPLS
jgi:hypothetical protein